MLYGRNHHNIIKQLSSNKKGGSSNGDPVWVNFCNDFRDYFTFSEYVLDVYDGAVRGCWGDRDALSIVGPCPRVVYLIVKELEARQIKVFVATSASAISCVERRSNFILQGSFGTRGLGKASLRCCFPEMGTN